MNSPCEKFGKFVTLNCSESATVEIASTAAVTIPNPIPRTSACMSCAPSRKQGGEVAWLRFVSSAVCPGSTHPALQLCVLGQYRGPWPVGRCILLVDHAIPQ